MIEIAGQEYFTIEDLEKLNSGFSRTQQWILRRSGKLRFLKNGKRILYKRDFINEYFANCEINKEPAQVA